MVEWLSYGVESCHKVMSLRLGFAMGRLENSVNPAVNSNLFEIREGLGRERRGMPFISCAQVTVGLKSPLPLWLIGCGRPLPFTMYKCAQYACNHWMPSNQSLIP